MPIAYDITYILIGEPFLWAKQFRRYDFFSLAKVTGGIGCSKTGAYWKIGAYGNARFEYRRMSLFSRKYSIPLKVRVNTVTWLILDVETEYFDTFLGKRVKLRFCENSDSFLSWNVGLGWTLEVIEFEYWVWFSGFSPDQNPAFP